MYRFFPICVGILPLVYVYQPPPSSRASPLVLLTSSIRSPKYLGGRVQILIEGGYYFISTGNRADTIREWILFDVQVLFEEISYMSSGAMSCPMFFIVTTDILGPSRDGSIHVHGICQSIPVHHCDYRHPGTIPGWQYTSGTIPGWQYTSGTIPGWQYTSGTILGCLYTCVRYMSEYPSTPYSNYGHPGTIPGWQYTCTWYGKHV